MGGGPSIDVEGRLTQNAILVVTRDDAVADVIAPMLAAVGYAALERAREGASALEILGQKRAALALVDASLAGDVDAVAFVRDARHRFGVPVIVLGAPNDAAAFTALRRARPTGYLENPPNERELRAAIEVALRKQELERDLELVQNTHISPKTSADEDARERHAKDQRLARAERLASLAKIAGAMAHEVNNPLTYVVANLGYSVESLDDVQTAFARLAATDPKTAPDVDRALGILREVTEALGEAQKGAGRVRRIMQDLARFVRAEDRATTLLDLPVILDESIAMATLTAAAPFEARRVYATTPLVEANASQLVQLFTNILVNAAEAVRGKSDGLVRVTTSTDEGGRACIAIADNGVGIASTAINRVFEPFFTTREGTSAMGLGLTVSREIASRLGGEVSVESSPAGATFRVVLPPAARSHEKAASKKPDAVPARRGRILVVDDEAAIAKLVERILRSAYDVVVENDARSALGRIARNERFDVIFCDLMMPHLTGMDLYDTLLASNPEVAKRIVFMTGGAFSERSREFLDKIEIVSIAKPFSAETLRSIARDYTR